MEIKGFIGAVRWMRACQKQYFRTRSAEALADSKRAERKVDVLIDEYVKGNIFNPQND